MKIRLANGDLHPVIASPWTTSGDTVTKWLVVLPGIGSMFMSDEELRARIVED